jgi:hypothetical protein
MTRKGDEHWPGHVFLQDGLRRGDHGIHRSDRIPNHCFPSDRAHFEGRSEHTPTARHGSSDKVFNVLDRHRPTSATRQPAGPLFWS